MSGVRKQTTSYGHGKESKRLLQHFEGSQASRSERSRIPITFNYAKTDALSWKCTYYRHFFKRPRHLTYKVKSSRRVKSASSLSP